MSTALPHPHFFTAALLSAAVLCFCGCDEKQPDIAPPPTAAPLPTELAETPDYSGDNAYVHCAALCALGPRPAGSAAYAAQADYLERYLTAAGWQVQRDSFAAEGVPMQNLRAVKGANITPRPLMLSCHIDTKSRIPDFIGADDGASGAAVLLELARTLPAEQAERIELVFFDGEEAFAPRMSESDGLYGSKFDAERRLRAGTLPRWQINLDMMGGRNKTIAIPALDTSDTMYTLYSAAVRDLGLSATKWTAWPGAYLDDHKPFMELGVDSLNLIAYFSGGGWWHTAKDDMSRICPRSLQESGTVVQELCRRLLQEGKASR